MTDSAPTLFGKPMRPDVAIDGWTLEIGIFQVDVTELTAHVGRAFGGRIRFGHAVDVLGPHRSPQPAADECEAWLMRTMIATAGAMGLSVRRDAE